MSDDSTVTFHVPGMEPVTTTMAELDRAARGLKHNRKEHRMAEGATVRVTNARGEIISEAHGHVVDLAFKVHPEKLDKEGEIKSAEFVERKHKVKLGDEDQ